MAESSEITIGTVLGGTYRIQLLIGRGGMGAVWMAEHLRLPGKRVAIKVLLTSNQSDESYARFRREAEIATRIGHPNIVEVLDWNTLPDGTTPYLVLEYLNGESLSARIARGPIPVETTLEIVRQIGSALHAAHRAGVIHRDLKPDNIYLCPTDTGGHIADHVKILDFGISKIRNSTTLQTQEMRLLGTPQYMAPEQASGRNQEIDERTDVFALGAIVYEMLTGRPAFDGDNLATVVYQVVHAEPEPLAKVVPGAPAHVVGAVQHALQKDRNARQPDVVTFVAELTGKPMSTLDRKQRAPVVTGEAYAPTTDAPSLPPPGVGTPQISGQAVAQPATPKRRAGLWIGLGVLVAASAAGAAYVLATRGAPDQVALADAAATRPPERAAAPVVDAAIAPQPTATAPSQPDAAPAATVETPRPRHPTPTPEPEGSEPDETADLPPELLEAERALNRGDYQTAIRMARHSLQDRKTPHAYSIIARGYCGLHDLGNAKAALQSVTTRMRARINRKCRAMGFPLD